MTEAWLLHLAIAPLAAILLLGLKRAEITAAPEKEAAVAGLDVGEPAVPSGDLSQL